MYLEMDLPPSFMQVCFGMSCSLVTTIIIIHFYFADYINRVVSVTFESDTRVVCTYLQQSSSKSCSIDYGVCGLQLSTMHSEGQATSSDNFIIDLSLENVQSSVYCYTVNASSGGTRVFVTGTRIRG